MKKENWIRHIEETCNIERPRVALNCMGDAWKDTVRKHLAEIPNCRECNERRKTRKAARNTRNMRHLMADMGMTRVRGNLGGIYYE